MILKLSIKQKRFADEYIISGNATEAARKAGYKNPRVQGSQNLTKLNILEYIKKRTKVADEAKTMSLKEAIERSSSIARREPQYSYSKKTNKLTGEVESEFEYEFTPSVEEAQKSIEHIIRCNGGFIDKQEIDVSATVIFKGESELED